MPTHKDQASLHLREGSPRRISHSSARPSRMGNRHMVALATDGRHGQFPVNAKKSGSMADQHGESNVQRRSSGPMTTVGEMIPFQKASRREPHLSSLDQNVHERNRAAQRRTSFETKRPQGRESGDSSHESGNNRESASRTFSDVHVNKPLPQFHPKPSGTDGKQIQGRSVRPKVKRVPFHAGESKTSSSSISANHTETATSVPSAVNHRESDQEQLKGHSSTSPRRRIVKRKSKTHATAKSREPHNHLSKSSAEERSSAIGFHSELEHARPTSEGVVLSQSTRTLSRAEISSRPSLKGSNPSTVSVTRQPENGQTRNPQQFNLPTSENNQDHPSITNGPLQSADRTVAHGGVDSFSHESRPQPRPPMSAREALDRSLRSRNMQSRSSSERATIQPAVATATELERSADVDLERHETRPNSVRRSHERFRHDNQGHGILERPRLNMQQISGMTPRARQREVIDVNSAASVLSRRVLQSSAQTAASESDPRETPPSSDARLREESVWVPMRRSQPQSAQQTQHSQPNHPPQTPFSLPSPRDDIISSPDTVFRNSPVAPLPSRTNSEMASLESHDVSNSTPVPRPSASIPTRRGLYRALSVTERSNESPGVTAARQTSSTPHGISSRMYANVDTDDMASWRRIESDHANAPVGTRQRHIYQDRARGRSSVLSSSFSDRRGFPAAMDTVPDITNTEEFPPLGPSQQRSSDAPQNTASQLRQDQVASLFASGNGEQSPRVRHRRNETPPPTPIPGQARNPAVDQSSDDPPDHMIEHLVLLASPIFGPLMLQASPAVLFSMLSRARRDFGGEFVELLIENVVLSLLAQHTYDVNSVMQNNSGAPPPATQDAIDSLEKVTVTKKMVSEEAFCSICHCDYTVDEILDQLPCKHSFHNQCITIWLKKSGTCPVCRHKLYADSDE